MSNCLKLISVFLRCGEITPEEKARSKVFYTIMGIVAFTLIMIPAAVIVGMITYALTIGVGVYGGNAQGLRLVLNLICIFSFIFGLNVMFNVFYFSKDLQYLLPLPISPTQLAASKFIYAMLSENIMQFILVAGAFTGYICAKGANVADITCAVVATLTMPVIPLVYCGIICMLIMYFTHFIKCKDTVAKITGVAAFVIIGGLALAAGCFNGFDVNKFILNLVQDGSSTANAINILFPNTLFLSDANIFNFIIYIAVTAAYFALFLIVAKLTYYKGVS